MDPTRERVDAGGNGVEILTDARTQAMAKLTRCGGVLGQEGDALCATCSAAGCAWSRWRPAGDMARGAAWNISGSGCASVWKRWRREFGYA